MNDTKTEENPYKLYSCVFPYQVKFTIEDDGHNTEATITTKSEEFYTATNSKDVLHQKELSDKYSKDWFSKRIIKYVNNQLWNVNPEEASLEYTGEPLITKLTEEQLSTFKRELMDSGDE